MKYISPERVSLDVNALFRTVFALLVGIGTFLVVLVATTEFLAPHVWPALLVSLPVAVVAGCLGVGYAYLGLRYREERSASGSASPRTVALLGGFSAAALGLVLTIAVVTALLAALSVPLLTTTLFIGFPAGILVGVTAGFFVTQRLNRQRTEKDGESVAA